jgi:hypothetical protein
MVASGEDAAVISEEAVRRELWVSFGSLVRSYVAAAQVGLEPPQVLVVQASEDELELVSSHCSVRLAFAAGKDEGYWVMHQAAVASDDTLLAEGAFRIGMDGLVEWTGLPGRQEMDAVAEALATLILDEAE